MSIEDKDGNEVVRLNTVWSFAFKAWIGLNLFIGSLLVTWGIWVTMSLSRHQEEIAVLKERTHHASGMTQSVNVGRETSDAGSTAGESHKEFVSVAYVSKKEGVTEKTITNWCNEPGRIQPQPVKDDSGRWVIAKD